MGQRSIKTSPIKIQRKIFQRSPFGALWLCFAINPLSNALNDCRPGYQIKRSNGWGRYYMPAVLYWRPKFLCANPRTSRSTDQNRGTMYNRYKNGVLPGYIWNA
jgi:hypothetical protein